LLDRDGAKTAYPKHADSQTVEVGVVGAGIVGVTDIPWAWLRVQAIATKEVHWLAATVQKARYCNARGVCCTARAAN
jgi:hypothetical protein